MQVEIDNRKFGGHCNTIVRRLGKIGQLVVVDATTQMVRLHAGGAAKPTIPARLHALGYSAGGSVSGLSAAVAGARSLICSAVGRLT